MEEIYSKQEIDWLGKLEINPTKDFLQIKKGDHDLLKRKQVDVGSTGAQGGASKTGDHETTREWQEINDAFKAL